MNFPTLEEGSADNRKEIYSFQKDADDKDHHSVFCVMFYNAWRWLEKRKQHYVELSRVSLPPAALIISILLVIFRFAIKNRKTEREREQENEKESWKQRRKKTAEGCADDKYL